MYKVASTESSIHYLIIGSPTYENLEDKFGDVDPREAEI